MTQRLHDPAQMLARETTRDQLAAMRIAFPGRVAYDAPDPADVSYSFVPGRLICSQSDNARVSKVLDARSADVRDIGPLEDDPLSLRGVVGRRIGPSDANSSRRTVPAPARDRRRAGHGDPALAAILAILDDELGEGVVTPDHYLHVANGDGKHCPATEPEETGLTGPWPPRTNNAQAGAGVRVAVIDTGWHTPAGQVPATSYLANDSGEVEPYVAGNRLRLYQGHGTFIAGVIKCRAPQAQVKHYRIGDGIAVSETEMVAAIYRALKDPAGPPHIINLSAGCHTRHGIGLLTFHRLWKSQLSKMPGTVLIAAAGNDASNLPFYPAARGWAIGVGSLDHRGTGPVSSFSNYGDSADVYLLGRNHVNAFPDGTYVCKEAPNKRDQRVFTHGLARWSGTSFAAPLFAGMVAAKLSATPGSDATTVAWDLVASAPQRQDPVHGWHRYLRVKDADWLN